ncbi:MAG: cell division ATP-binding protein FtsE [Novibacillus thermophilus]|uniref:Cell division ATP-binding protein FtsE n=1 Tax=Novibacillus thermophilus TaxID=1471761 RepID=A0A1U9KAI0_9BACL|nr:cell division ATP-binding protein FtsE [Novibacillus thermophilus]AQS57075.1 cell division ATP-binding protein FtsE [Novibacillus thermophilus]
MIEMYGVWKVYENGNDALQNIDIKIGRGEFVYVVGPSGAGKSTFIKLMYREERPTKGQIYINGINVDKVKERKIPQIRRNIGVVFQDFRLLPRMTSFENVAFAMEVVETPRKRIEQRVRELFELVGLEDRMDAYPDELSGGEMQRVAIARAMANKPSVIIADEPTGNLDPETSWGIMELFEEINDLGTTVVMATHNRDIVNQMKKRVVAIEDGQIVRDELRGEYGYES